MDQPLKAKVLAGCIELLDKLDESTRNNVLASLSTYFNGPPVQQQPPRPGTPGSRGIMRPGTPGSRGIKRGGG